MKKSLALLLILSLSFSVFSVAAFAAPEGNPAEDYKCYDRFLDYFNIDPTMVDVYLYDEINCHYTDPEDDSTLDWVLIQACAGEGSPYEYMEDIGGRIVCLGNLSYPFDNSYGIYDVKEDRFVGLGSENINEYDELREVFSTVEFHSPVFEYGYDEFITDITKKDADCTDPYYRVLCYRKRTDSDHGAHEGAGFDVEWALVEAYAEPSVPIKEKPASFYAGNSRLTSREAVWPFGSKIALYIPSDKRFISLKGYPWYDYEGLEDAILAQDFDTLGIDNHEFLYRERFLDEYFPHWRETDNWWYALSIPFYDERYYHKDTDGSIDWVLIYTYNRALVPWEVRTGCVIGNRAIYDISECSAFESWYGVYDVKSNRFIALPNATDEAFPDLTDVVNHLKLGVMIGDVDRDGIISILDATYIQKILAGLMHNTMIEDMDVFYGQALKGDTIKYVSDYDRDGERSVLDATGIQKYLAGIK